MITEQTTLACGKAQTLMLPPRLLGKNMGYSIKSYKGPNIGRQACKIYATSNFPAPCATISLVAIAALIQTEK